MWYVRSLSIGALWVAAASLLGATLLRLALALLGIHSSFALYIPAALIAGLVAGAPAGIAVVAGGAVIGFLTFAPPHADFAIDLSAVAGGIFSVSALVVVLVAHLYRHQVEKLRTREKERDLLLKELEHRGRNTYAIVDSIVRTSLKSDPERAETISRRVLAVSRSNDLVNWSSTTSVPFRALLLRVLDGIPSERLILNGPNVELTARSARNLALVFHELATNARKYGALSTSEGRVALTWDFEAPTIHVTWQEKGGPPAQAPATAGFGTEVIDRTLAALSGSVFRDYDPQGFSCRMSFAV
jgi:two-component sensor histidine kinase